MRAALLALAGFLFALSCAARAQEPLLPEAVAASAAEHYPAVLAALAERRGAAADVLSADGAFDTVFSVDGRARATGFYSGDVIEAKAERALGPYGAKVYGGYRISDGDFPVYEDQFYTNEGGELKVGVLFSLLRDRLIDDRRFGRRDARLALSQADLELLLTRIGVQREALLSYYEWVEAGRELAVYSDLLALAEARQDALAEEVRRGARARIFLTENAQNLTRRRTLVEAARRDLALAANRLSLYYRDAGGAPVVPGPDRLPGPVAVPTPAETAALATVLQRRPDLAALRLAAERARGRVELAENALRPRLDLGIEAGQDLGAIDEDAGFTRDQGEVILGLTFEVPLANRAARGAKARADAELTRIEAERRLAEDRIEAELAGVALRLETAQRLVALAALEVEQAEAMRQAEERRFRGGASDFFLVNLREQAAADARIGYAMAVLALNAARVTYDAAVLDTGRLGLVP